MCREKKQDQNLAVEIKNFPEGRRNKTFRGGGMKIFTKTVLKWSDKGQNFPGLQASFPRSYGFPIHYLSCSKTNLVTGILMV